MKDCSCALDYIIDGKLCYSFYHKKNVVGVFYLVFCPTSIYIDWILIDEKFREGGMGNKITEFILEFCKKFSSIYKYVWLLVDFDNEIAQHIYRKHGFSFDNWIGSFCYRMTYQF
jgi:ribosomal protein S18 acetylase RimI-like enzyme